LGLTVYFSLFEDKGERLSPIASRWCLTPWLTISRYYRKYLGGMALSWGLIAQHFRKNHDHLRTQRQRSENKNLLIMNSSPLSKLIL
jgi:hypothetical protein